MNKIIIGLIAVVAVYGAIAGSVALVGGNQSVPQNLGAIGTRFPNGISVGTDSPAAAGDFKVDGSTLNVIAANNNIGVGTTSPNTSGDVVVDSTGTSTLMLASSGAGGGCINIETNLGTTVRAYVVGTSWVISAGTCK